MRQANGCYSKTLSNGLCILTQKTKRRILYNESVAEDVYEKIPAFLDDAQKLLIALEQFIE